MSKLAVVGSRGFTNYELLKLTLDKYEISEIISGGAIGADKLAEKYAHEKNIKLTIFYPDWNKYGKSAGPIRNKLIIEACDEVVAFWDGISTGTKSSIEIAKKLNKKHNIINISIEK